MISQEAGPTFVVCLYNLLNSAPYCWNKSIQNMANFSIQSEYVKQNEFYFQICVSYSQIPQPNSQMRIRLTLGAEAYTADGSNAYIARQRVAIEALLRTEYSFTSVPSMLQAHVTQGNAM